MARPRKQPPEELRQAIIAVAHELLRDHPVGGLSARNLAGQLSIAPSAIYRLFPAMSDILMEVNRDTFSRLDALFDSLPDDLSASEKLLETGRRYIDFMQANPNLWRALFEGERDPDSFPEWYAASIRRLMSRIAALLQQACPDLSPSQAEDRAGRLYVLAHGAIALHFDRRLGLITTARAQDIIEDAIHSMIGQVATTARKTA